MPASVESVDQSFGGNMTQDEMRAIMRGDPNLDPLSDYDTWNAYSSKTGHTFTLEQTISKESQYRMFTQIGLGNRVSINLNLGKVGHSVVVHKAILEVFTKLDGSVSSRVLFYVMDPANGGYYHYINGNSILNAYNIFYIVK